MPRGKILKGKDEKMLTEGLKKDIKWTPKKINSCWDWCFDSLYSNISLCYIFWSSFRFNNCDDSSSCCIFWRIFFLIFFNKKSLKL